MTVPPELIGNTPASEASKLLPHVIQLEKQLEELTALHHNVHYSKNGECFPYLFAEEREKTHERLNIAIKNCAILKSLIN